MRSPLRFRTPQIVRLALAAAVTASLLVAPAAVLAPAALAGSSPSPAPNPAQAACDQQAAALMRSAPPPASEPTATVNFTNAGGQQVPLIVTVAATLQQQELGLMGIPSLPQDMGELFDFSAQAPATGVTGGFWMCDTLIPLSVAFIGSNDTVQEVDDMQANSLAIHIPQQAYTYAIEANQGWFASNGIGPGSQVDLSGALALESSSPTP
jgi:uncharacterized membrane protein (UPF0127 family)